MKNFGYACVALGALLSATDLYGLHYKALDILKTVNVAASNSDRDDAQQKWNENVDNKLRNTQSLLIDATADKGYIRWQYNNNWYCCSLDGQLYNGTNGSWVRANSNIRSEDIYNSWSHLKLTNIGDNQISLWLSFDENGTSRVVVDDANLNVLCGIIGDNVVTLGNINARGGFAALGKNYYSNFAYLASPWFCACTHYGSNYNSIGSARDITGNSTNALNELDSFFNTCKTDLFGGRGFTNVGTVRAEKATTDNLNYSDHGNTHIKEFIQKGNDRNVSVKYVLGLTETFNVKIDSLSGTQTLSVPGGECLGNNIYGYRDQSVSIKTDSDVEFKENSDNASVNQQQNAAQSAANETQDNANERTEADKKTPDGGTSANQNNGESKDSKVKDSSKKKGSQKKANPNKKQSKKKTKKHRKNDEGRRKKPPRLSIKNDPSSDNEETPVEQQQAVNDHSNDNDNDNQNGEQQPPADQSNADKDVADRIQHPENFLDLIRRGVPLNPINNGTGQTDIDKKTLEKLENNKKKKKKEERQNILTQSTLNAALKEIRNQTEQSSDSDSDGEESSSSSEEF